MDLQVIISNEKWGTFKTLLAQLREFSWKFLHKWYLSSLAEKLMCQIHATILHLFYNV